MHRKPRAPRLVRLAQRIINIYRRVTGQRARRQFDQWCSAMEREIASRPWYCCNG